MAFSTRQHDRQINRTLKEIQSGVYDNIKSLEKEIADLVSQGYDPVVVRPQILAAFERHAVLVKESVEPVKGLSEDWLKQLDMAYSNEDLVAQNTLATQTANTISSTVNNSAEGVMEVVVLGAAAGVATSVLTKQVRGRISGVMMDSENPEVRRQQRKLETLMRKGATAAELGAVVAKIKRLEPEVNTAGSLRDTAIRTVESSVMAFDGAFAAGVSARAGVEKWTYSGGIIGTSREFCKAHVGNTYTREEIDSIWSGGWSGKEPGDPFVVKGGYNCLHYWVPVEPDEQV